MSPRDPICAACLYFSFLVYRGHSIHVIANEPAERRREAGEAAAL